MGELRADGTPSTAQLHGLRGACEAYCARMAAHIARNRSKPVPGLSPTKPGRLGAWCRTVRAVLSRAEGGVRPTHVVAKAHRVADRIAARVKAASAGRESPTDLAGAIRQLDAVIAWCDRVGDGPAEGPQVE